ncbi:eukaryotic translation initiation factor 3 subunit F-like [Watersipora subatra]|uniref:eukaryotic translation initiation factor 3 subunit F-like n=1 Tax=Watersipora subatra TaxID=2589382 RepID=UPI00355B4C57
MAAVRRVCNIHPVVLFSIVDSFERRPEDSGRVIGTLLGNVDATGVVEVTNSFTVPHNEVEDEVAVDIEFAKNMYELHKMVNSSEVVVGWYSTGPDVTEHSVLIHEYYAREAKNPVHITIDTTLRNAEMGMKAYISAPLGVPGRTMGSMFTPIPVELACYETEQIGLNPMLRGKSAKSRTVEISTGIEQVESACESLLSMLNVIQQYVNDVVNGDKAADPSLGRFLMNLVSSVPKIDPEKFEGLLNANFKDLLMVAYLANLTKTQLTITEKLTTATMTTNVKLN